MFYEGFLKKNFIQKFIKKSLYINCFAQLETFEFGFNLTMGPALWWKWKHLPSKYTRYTLLLKRENDIIFK